MAALIAGDASQPWRISMAPPPGLNPVEDALPAKVPLHDAPSYPQPHVAARAGPNGKWVSAVLQVIPHLNSQQLHQALGILDRAIIHTRQAKALESIALGAYQVWDGTSGAEEEAAEDLSMQVHKVNEQQQALLGELSCLGSAACTALTQTKWNLDAAPFEASGLVRSEGAQLVPEVPGLTKEHCKARPLDLLPGAPGLTKEHCGASSLDSPQPARALLVPEGPPRAAGKAERQPRPAPAAGRQVKTLSTSLQLLSHEDPDCLFIVRRINKLGFKAARKLKQHFSAYGSVVRVLVAHSTVRGDPRVSGPARARRRPSSLGFVQMATSEAVQKVLEMGAEQEVDGSLIRVQRFERQHGDAMLAEDEDDRCAKPGFPDDGDRLEDFGRQQSAVSTAFTASTTAYSEESEESQ